MVFCWPEVVLNIPFGWILDFWFIFLSDSYLKENWMVSGILAYACKACQVRWRACPIHQTNLLPGGERDVLVLHLTLILAGKC